MSNQSLVEDLYAEYRRLQHIHPETAKHLLETAQIAGQYFVRSKRHGEILESASRRIEKGEDPNAVYRDEARLLLETWPDADAYGASLVMLRKITHP